MNLYFLFEGKTELLVYEKWLKDLLPNHTVAEKISDVVSNHYLLRGDLGMPYIFNIAAEDAIQTINKNPVFNYLVLVLDADDQTVAERTEYAQKIIAEQLKKQPYKSLPVNCELKIIVQQVCVETWFLGNLNLIEITDEYETTRLRTYLNHFDITKENTELMPLLHTTNYSTNALFHEGYLRTVCEVLRERYRKRKFWGVQAISYSKAKPNLIIQNDHFLYHLQQRIATQPTHLHTFQAFLAFCESVK
jgi:hypothetical protein